MNYLIQLICISSIFITASAAPSKDLEIEEFIDRLLDSDKFEKLADKIAERAADRIITLQQLNTHVDDKKNDVRENDKSKKESRAFENNKIETNDTAESKKSDNDKSEARESDQEKTEATVSDHYNSQKRSDQHRHVAKPKDDSGKENDEANNSESKENNESSEHNKSKEKTRSSERDSKVVIEDENEKYEGNEHSGKEKKYKDEKPKIDSAVVIRNLANFSGEDLSLNFKHFTTGSQNQYTTARTRQNKYFRGEKEEEKDSIAYNQVHVTPTTTTKKVTSNKEKNVSKMFTPKEDSDLSIESKDSRESKESEEVGEKNIEKNKEKKSMKNHTENSKSTFDENSVSSQSLSEESVSGSGSNESKFATSMDHTSHKSSETMAAAHKDEKDNDIKEAFLFKQRAKESSEESKSKSINNTTISVRAKESTANRTDVNASGFEMASDDNEVSITDSEKVEEKSKPETINLRDKVRKANGKLFAFAQSPDYEEYHEKLSQILQSVKDKKDSSNKDLISQDLLDFVEPS